MGQYFESKQQIIEVLSPILSGFEAFWFGSLALGIHLGNLDYREHDDIDVLCPSEHHQALFRKIVDKILIYPADYYYPDNAITILHIGKRRIMKRATSELVEFHMIGFKNLEKERVLYHGLKVPHGFPFQESIHFGNGEVPVATPELLAKSKYHALSKYLYARDEVRYINDLLLLDELKNKPRLAS